MENRSVYAWHTHSYPHSSHFSVAAGALGKGWAHLMHGPFHTWTNMVIALVDKRGKPDKYFISNFLFPLGGWEENLNLIVLY